MDIQEEIRSLSRISERFRRSKGPKSKWPTEFQLRVLRLIDQGYSPSALSKKLNIPVQTYYHWRRVWKNRPKSGAGFIEVLSSGKLKDCSAVEKQPTPSAGIVLIFPSGARIENLSEEILLRILSRAV